MQLSDVLAADRISIDSSASSKKILLEKASKLLAAPSDGAHARAIFESLCQRERLGSTGLGHGVAIPHGRPDEQDEVIGALIRLTKGIGFDAPDSEPVDLFFALVVPSECTNTHIKLLSEIAEIFADEKRRASLRAASTPQEILEELSRDPSG